MSVLVETTLGDITIDLLYETCPLASIISSSVLLVSGFYIKSSSYSSRSSDL